MRWYVHGELSRLNTVLCSNNLTGLIKFFLDDFAEKLVKVWT